MGECCAHHHPDGSCRPDGKVMSRAVLAIKPGGPEVLRQVLDHTVHHPNGEEIMVKMAATGVNTIDIAMREGGIRPIMIPFEFPCVLGGDGSGTVVMAPKGSKFKEGDRVMFNTAGLVPKKGSYASTYAEYCVLYEEWAAKIPDDVPIEDAAAVPLVALTALGTVNKLPCEVGQRVLILGASGGIGQFGIQFAKLKGWHVTAVCNEKNADKARLLGADDIFPSEEVDPKCGAVGHDSFKARFGESEETMFDGILDFVGSDLAAVAVGSVLKRSGHIAVHMTRQTSLVKLAWWGALNALKVGPSPRVNLLNGPNPMGELDRISAWIGEGKVKIPEVLRMPVAEAARAHELIAEEGDEGGRIVLTW